MTEHTTEPEVDTKRGQVTVTINGANVPTDESLRNHFEAEIQGFLAAELRNADPGFDELPPSATLRVDTQYTE